MAETHQADMAGQLAEWKARGKAPADQQEPHPPAKVIQLPLWPEPKRGAPNAVLRGALFAAIQGKGRQYMDRKELIATQDGVTIRYTGGQLDQADLDVWEQALHLARTQALGTECYFTAHGFLKALGRATGKQNHEWLKSAFARLAATAVEITSARRTYFGSLIEGGVRDEDTGRYVVQINPKLAKFYGRSQWTQLGLGAAPAAAGQTPGVVAARLLCQPRRALPADRSAYLHKLSGSQTKQVWKFKQNLTQALEELAAVGAIKAFEIRDELVHVRTVPSKSQQKHLAARRPPDRQRKIGTVYERPRHGIRATEARYTSDRGTVYERPRHGIRATEARYTSDRGPAEIRQKSNLFSHLADRPKSANRSLIVYNPRARKTLRLCGPFWTRKLAQKPPPPTQKTKEGGRSPLTPLGLIGRGSGKPTPRR